MTPPLAASRDPAASMSLITELMRNPLDPAYQQEADRRAAAGLVAVPPTRSPLLILTVVLLGFALIAAALSLRVPSGVQQKQRDALVSRIEVGQRSILASTTQITALRAQIATAQAGALSRNDGTVTAQELLSLSAATGLTAVRGPGIVLQVDDAPGSDPGSGADPRADPGNTAAGGQGQLSSTDLQLITNGLWQSGAEAIAINGQRLTAQSAIRSAGQAILVNFTALQPPYTVSAIGPASMGKDFARSEGGIYLQGLSQSFGIRKTLSDRTDVSLPAAAPAGLRYAKETP
ncbi:DUF881 domain-containing protein [Dermatophilaceae bacterium Sec6.4]